VLRNSELPGMDLRNKAQQQYAYKNRFYPQHNV
jgi:hypothetical protein